MDEVPPAHPPGDGRVRFGVPGLDEMLDGGLMPHRPYLIVGPSGTGKTTLALQFLCEGVRQGERCLYVTVEDPPNEVFWNHRSLRPELDSVEVFDAIPDVMRYEHTPFKDISAVRKVVPFAKIPPTIRQTPEFSSVEITGTALEQLLRSEVQRHAYTRLVIDSLTALQYFCMKGFDPTVGAQTFLRFLTDLRTTTVLTVESALEDVESPERMLARGEIRMFRWELDGLTVRAVGVEKFRGSSHDVRLHPYRIGSKGIDIQLGQTISRDTRRIVEPAISFALRDGEPAPVPAPVPAGGAPAATESLSEQIADLVALGVDVTPLRHEVEVALAAVGAGRTEEVLARMTRISAMAVSLAPIAPPTEISGEPMAGGIGQAYQRVTARAEGIRSGSPPTRLPPPGLLSLELAAILAMVPVPPPASASVAPPSAPAVPPSAPVERAAPVATAHPEPPTPAPPPLPPAFPVAEPTPVKAAPRRRARPAPALTLPAPPPLPAVAAFPGSPPSPSAPPLPTGPTAAAGAASRPAGAKPAPTPAAPTVRRRRRTAAEKAGAEAAAGVSAPSPPAAVGGTEPVPAPAAPAKARRRAPRRKKAPPVLTAHAVGPPPDSPSPSDAPAGTSPTAEPAKPSEPS